MENNLEELAKNVSVKLLETIALVDVLQEVGKFQVKEDTLIYLIRNNIKNSFEEIELCRKMISVSD